MTGIRDDYAPTSWIGALSRALWGDFQLLGHGDGGDLDKEDRQIWSRDRLIERIDAEIAELEELSQTFDFALIAQDRAEAGARALFDPSKDATLARRYESEAQRGFFKTLKEFRQAEGKDSGNPSLCGRALPKTKARVGQQSRGRDRLGVRFSCRATTCPSPGRRRHCPTRASARG